MYNWSMKTELVLLSGLLGSVVLAAGADTALKGNPYPYPFEAMPGIYHEGWIDLNKNGEMDVYEDPSAGVEARVEDLLGRMTQAEKVMQLCTLYGYRAVLKDKYPTEAWKSKRVWKDGVANIDEQGAGWRHRGDREVSDTPERNAHYVNNTQRFFIEQTRLGIPVDFTNEGINGASLRHGTSFPMPHSQGMTWNPELIREMGRVTGREARAVGYTNVYAPILDVARDQRWGRWEGTIAEDPFLVAEIGKALCLGIQEGGAISSPKHYVGYGENKGARGYDSRTDPHITAQTFEAIHFYPFRRVFTEAHPLGVMCAYNDVNGMPVAASAHLLKERLRGELGFEGYVVSDSHAVERLATLHRMAADQKEAHNLRIKAGLNVWTTFSPPDAVARAINASLDDGSLAQEDVDAMVRDVLRVKFMRGMFDRPYVADPKSANALVGTAEAARVALQVAREALVLLKNEGNLLPLDAKKLKRVAVIGPNADTGCYRPDRYGPTDYDFVTVRKGLERALAGTGAEVVYAKGCDHVNPGWPDSELVPVPITKKERDEQAKAVALAKSADVAIVVLGDNGRTSGESHTRTSLNLPGRQEELLEAVQATGTPTVLVLMHGRPPSINWAARNTPAILSCGLLCGHGGTAVAEALLGRYNPGGKTNGTWLKSAGQIPFNFPAKPKSNYEPELKNGSYNAGALWPFGFGLSYTTFAIGKPTIEPLTMPGEATLWDRLCFRDPAPMPAGWRVHIPVTNTGKVAGDEVVQLYVSYTKAPIYWFDQMLRGFKRVHLEPGETKTVTLDVPLDHLKIVLEDQSWALPDDPFELRIGTSSIHLKWRTLIKDGKVVRTEAVKPSKRPPENVNPLTA